MAAVNPALVAKAEALLKAAHTPDANWPLNARAAHRPGGGGNAKKKASK